MTWSYRLFKKKNGYQVHEVYYDEKGKIETWTEEPIFQELFETRKEAIDFFEMIAYDLRQTKVIKQKP